MSKLPSLLRHLQLPVLLATVGCCTSVPAPHTAAPALAEGATLRFAAYGDTRTCHSVHRRIVQDVLGFHPAWVLQTGDLVEAGSALDQWKTFDEITGALRRAIPYYPSPGNHDGSSRGYYEQRVTQPILSGTKRYYSFEKGNLHFVSIDTQDDLSPSSPQGRWLEADLAQAQAAGRFILPFFHKAIFSIGQHAVDSDVLALRPILHPLFQRYGVRLVFEGHDHIYYRTVRDGITYVVTGGGGAPLYDDKHRDSGVSGDVFEKVHHFCMVDVYDQKLVVTAYRMDLTKVDSFEVAMAK